MPVVARLGHVFSNLLDSALKHTSIGGEVNVVGRQTTTDSVHNYHGV